MCRLSLSSLATGFLEVGRGFLVDGLSKVVIAGYGIMGSMGIIIGVRIAAALHMMLSAEGGRSAKLPTSYL